MIPAPVGTKGPGTRSSRSSFIKNKSLNQLGRHETVLKKKNNLKGSRPGKSAKFYSYPTQLHLFYHHPEANMKLGILQKGAKWALEINGHPYNGLPEWN